MVLTEDMEEVMEDVLSLIFLKTYFSEWFAQIHVFFFIPSEIECGEAFSLITFFPVCLENFLENLFK